MVEFEKYACGFLGDLTHPREFPPVCVRSDFFKVGLDAFMHEGNGVGDVEQVDFEDWADGRVHPVLGEFRARLNQHFLHNQEEKIQKSVIRYTF